MKRACIVFFLLSIISSAVSAQSPEIGRIAIYADSFRTVNEVDLPMPYTSFDIYIFCQPSVNGAYCAEFAIESSTESFIAAATEWHPGLSIVLGEMTSGVSACLLECQTDWFWISRVTMLNSNTEPATIAVAKHPDVGYYQFASCLPGSPIEQVFFGPGLSVNSAFTPDTDPPVPVSIDIEDDMHLLVYFDEKIFEPDALNPASYVIYTTDGTEDTVPVGFAALQGEEDRVWIVLDEPLMAAPHTLELVGLRDVIGNPAPPGTGIAFTGMDTSPPEPLYAYTDGYRIVVWFSEAVDRMSAEDHTNYSLKCNECVYTPNPYSAELRPDGRSVYILVSSPINLTFTYDIWIEGIADLSGNVMTGISILTFSASEGTPPRVSEISLPTENSLEVLWSKPMDESSTEDLSNYLLVRDGPPRVPLTLISAELVSPALLRIDFLPATNRCEAHTLFLGSEVMGEFGLYARADSFSITPLDTIPPHMTSAECDGLMRIVVEFSEAIVSHFAGTGGHFIVYPTGSPGMPVHVAGVAWYGSAGWVRIDLAEAMTAGVQYSVYAVDLDDPAGNVAAPHEMIVSCIDDYPPEVLEIFLPDFTLTHLNIHFDETVNTAAADPSSYLLYPAVDSTAAVGIDTVTVHDEGTRVELVTAASLNARDMYTLRMIGIGDLFGNMIDPDTTWSFPAVESITPSLVNLTVMSGSIVLLEFDEPLDSVTAEDATKYAVVEVADTSVHLPLQSAELDAGSTMVNLKVEGTAPVGTAFKVLILGVTDPSGNALYTESVEFEFVDDILPHLLSADGPSARNAVVYFDEPVTLATSQVESNYTLHIAGDSSMEVAILLAERLPDQMSIDLLLGTDLEQHAFYTLKVSGIDDFAGNTIIPDSTVFQYIDDKPPLILDIRLVNSLRLAVTFNEPVDSATAVDTDNYLIYLSADASQQIGVTSIDWTGSEVRLALAAEPIANVDYTVRIDSVEDRFGNACTELEGAFKRVVNVASANMALYIDEYRSTNELDAEVMYEINSFYVFVEAGGNGVFAAEYALSPPETYIGAGYANNPAWVASEQGNPYSGHSVTLSMCAQDWFWITRVDCLCIQPGQQEIVFIRPHPAASSVRIASCLPGHPLESVRYTRPLLINVVYLDVMIDSWDASFRSGGVELNWSIKETEAMPVFVVSRTPAGTESWQKLDNGMILGDGLSYTIRDSDLEFGKSYRYRVECIENDERKVLFETDAIATPVMPVALHQNSPNPFNPATSIGFYLPKPGYVRLEIFDVNGRLIDVLADRHYASGEHSIDWNGTDRSGAGVSSGVYFYRLTAGKESMSRKMVLLR